MYGGSKMTNAKHISVLEALLSRDIDEGDNILSLDEVNAISAGLELLRKQVQSCPRCGSTSLAWNGLKKPRKWCCGRCRLPRAKHAYQAHGFITR